MKKVQRYASPGTSMPAGESAQTQQMEKTIQKTNKVQKVYGMPTPQPGKVDRIPTKRKPVMTAPKKKDARTPRYTV